MQQLANKIIFNIVFQTYLATLFSFTLIYDTIFRQKTDMDKVCLKQNGTTGEPVGSRVYCDCDVLMKKVMAHLLPAEQLQEWEGQGEDRMIQYDTQRDSV